MSKFNFLANNFPKETFSPDAEQESHNMNLHQLGGFVGRWSNDLSGCVSKSSWGTRTRWQRPACWSQFPEARSCSRSCSQSTHRCQEAQQPMSALDFCRTSLSTVTSDLWPPPDHPHQPFPIHPHFTSIWPPEVFHPSFNTNFLSTSPPSHHTRSRPRVIQSAVCLATCRTEEGVCYVPPMVSGKVVPLLELGWGAPGHAISSRCVAKSILVQRSRQLVDRWDVKACYIVECERNSAKTSHSGHP